VVQPEDLRAELATRYAHYASRDRYWPPKRHSVSPV
jgi:hypothetical protein